MKKSEIYKINELVKKIESGDFDYHCIDSIFIKLREFSGGCEIFREVSHFIAHNKERNEGQFSDYTTSNFLKLMFFYKYTYQKNQFDIISGVPSWVFHLAIIRVSEIDEAECQKKYKKSKAGLKERLRQKFIVTKDECKAKENAKNKDIENIISLLSSFAIHSGSVFSIDALFEEILSCLRSNGADFSDDALRMQREKIIICVLLLLHNTNFKFRDMASARIVISKENDNLILIAELPIDKINISICVLMTELKVEQWCSVDVISYLLQSQSLPDAIKINSDFKIALI